MGGRQGSFGRANSVAAIRMCVGGVEDAGGVVLHSIFNYYLKSILNTPHDNHEKYKCPNTSK